MQRDGRLVRSLPGNTTSFCLWFRSSKRRVTCSVASEGQCFAGGSIDSWLHQELLRPRGCCNPTDDQSNSKVRLGAPNLLHLINSRKIQFGCFWWFRDWNVFRLLKEQLKDRGAKNWSRYYAIRRSRLNHLVLYPLITLDSLLREWNRLYPTFSMAAIEFNINNCYDVKLSETMVWCYC